LSISCTVAVRVTTLPAVTEVTVLPAEVTERLVVVRGLATAKALLQTPLNTITAVSQTTVNAAGILQRNIRWKTSKPTRQLTNKSERTMAVLHLNRGGNHW
jgi:hypothetical protein